MFEGQADVWIGEAHVTLTAGQLVVVPAGRKHGFANNGQTVLCIQSTLAEPIFEASSDDKRETTAVVAEVARGLESRIPLRAIRGT